MQFDIFRILEEDKMRTVCMYRSYWKYYGVEFKKIIFSV